MAVGFLANNDTSYIKFLFNILGGTLEYATQVVNVVPTTLAVGLAPIATVTDANGLVGSVGDVTYPINPVDVGVPDAYSDAGQSSNSSDLWYKFNGDLTDSSGNLNDGSVTGPHTFDTESVLLTGGITSRVNMHSSGEVIGDSFSFIQALIPNAVPAASSKQTIYYRGISTNPEFVQVYTYSTGGIGALFIANGGASFSFYETTGTPLKMDGSVEIISVTFNATTREFKIFVDGVEVYSGVVAAIEVTALVMDVHIVGVRDWSVRESSTGPFYDAKYFRGTVLTPSQVLSISTSVLGALFIATDQIYTGHNKNEGSISAGLNGGELYKINPPDNQDYKSSLPLGDHRYTYLSSDSTDTGSGITANGVDNNVTYNGDSASYDGATSYTQISFGSSQVIKTTAVTIKPRSITGVQRLSTHTNGSGTASGTFLMVLLVNADVVVVTNGTGTTSASTLHSVIKLNQVHDIVATFNSTTGDVDMWVDGVVQRKVLGVVGSTTSHTDVGIRLPNIDGFYDGEILDLTESYTMFTDEEIIDRWENLVISKNLNQGYVGNSGKSRVVTVGITGRDFNTSDSPDALQRATDSLRGVNETIVVYDGVTGTSIGLPVGAQVINSPVAILTYQAFDPVLTSDLKPVFFSDGATTDVTIDKSTITSETFFKNSTPTLEHRYNFSDSDSTDTGAGALTDGVDTGTITYDGDSAVPADASSYITVTSTFTPKSVSISFEKTSDSASTKQLIGFQNNYMSLAISNNQLTLDKTSGGGPVVVYPYVSDGEHLVTTRRTTSTIDVIFNGLRVYSSPTNTPASSTGFKVFRKFDNTNQSDIKLFSVETEQTVELTDEELLKRYEDFVRSGRNSQLYTTHNGTSKVVTVKTTGGDFTTTQDAVDALLRGNETIVVYDSIDPSATGLPANAQIVDIAVSPEPVSYSWVPFA